MIMEEIAPLKRESLFPDGTQVPLLTAEVVIVGFGAAALNAAVHRRTPVERLKQQNLPDGNTCFEQVWKDFFEREVFR